MQPLQSQWKGKKVAFLGDSITDAIHVGTTKNYWQFLEESLGIIPLVYGRNGQRWADAAEQLEKLYKVHGQEVDAVIILLGTNDFNDSIPPGDWYTIRMESTNANGVMLSKPRRIMNEEPGTVRGCINQSMKRIRELYPCSQVILMTPIHRAYATFGKQNVQPDESFPNLLGLFVESYVQIIREAADVWSCPLIDLYRNSGLYPLAAAHGVFFHDDKTDRLHPNAAGHARIAELMQYQMLTLPASFR